MTEGGGTGQYWARGVITLIIVLFSCSLVADDDLDGVTMRMVTDEDELSDEVMRELDLNAPVQLDQDEPDEVMEAGEHEEMTEEVIEDSGDLQDEITDDITDEEETLADELDDVIDEDSDLRDELDDLIDEDDDITDDLEDVEEELDTEL